MSNQLKAKCLLVGGKPEDEAACRCSVRWRRLKKKRFVLKIRVAVVGPVADGPTGLGRGCQCHGPIIRVSTSHRGAE
jgi:hypothetical protein